MMENQMPEIVHGVFSVNDLQGLFNRDKKDLAKEVGFKLLNP